MKVLPDLTLDIIPVDYPINLMIVAGWHTALHKYTLKMTSFT